VKKAGVAFAAIVAWAAPAYAADTAYSFDAAQYEKKRFELGGYLELKAEHFDLNRGGAFYELNFAGEPRRGSLDRQTAILKLTGKARAGDWLLTARTHSELARDQIDHGRDNRFDELLVSWKPSSGVSLDAGKTVLKWGKGYAWNPVGFVERPKDPNDPDLAREGFTVLTADLVRTFQEGPLQTVAFTPVLLPVSSRINEDFGRPDHVNVAARLYLLYRDTDVDLYFLNQGSRSRRFGADFSRNLAPNVEIHGEWARIDSQEFPTLDAAGNVRRRSDAVTSWLIGLRYLSERDTTYILELYRNGPGFTSQEYRRFTEFIERASRNENSPLLQRVRSLAQAYGRQNPLRDYLYLRVSQKEPFDILYFAPALTAIVNLQDKSYSIAPELLYTGVRNVELRARAIFLGGGSGTDFGEKQNERRFEMLARFYF
jgi:hypothetical protein